MLLLLAEKKEGQVMHEEEISAYDEIHMAHVYSTYVYIHIFLHVDNRNFRQVVYLLYPNM